MIGSDDHVRGDLEVAERIVFVWTTGLTRLRFGGIWSSTLEDASVPERLAFAVADMLFGIVAEEEGDDDEVVVFLGRRSILKGSPLVFLGIPAVLGGKNFFFAARGLK